MKTLSQKRALSLLTDLRESFRRKIENEFEPRAKDCITCDVKGSCCTDAHFVNVHISKLDALAISRAVSELPPELREKVERRNQETVAKMAGEYDSTYSCPLFEPGHGCLVHQTAKPVACINHACYENSDDLPPDEILLEVEKKIGAVNDRVYRSNWSWLPIPVWFQKINPNNEGRSQI